MNDPADNAAELSNPANLMWRGVALRFAAHYNPHEPDRRGRPESIAMPRSFAALFCSAFLATGAAVISCGNRAEGAPAATFALTSPAFAAGASIPSRFTCEGDSTSLPLAWSSPPQGTRSLALIMEDPDAPDPRAPQRVWVHWVLYNLSPTAGVLPEGAASALPAGTRTGTNDRGRTTYAGPCPPIGSHRYFLKLYALDVVLPDLGDPTKAQLQAAFTGHVLAETELMGRYQKKAR